MEIGTMGLTRRGLETRAAKHIDAIRAHVADYAKGDSYKVTPQPHGKEKVNKIIGLTQGNSSATIPSWWFMTFPSRSLQAHSA
jgi:hypothetical protein